MIHIGLVGYGYWGKNLAREFAKVQNAKITKICDLDINNLKQAKSDNPAIDVTNDIQLFLADTSIDAVIIATPIKTHFQIAFAAIKANKHVLVEKPLTTNLKEAMILNDVAQEKNVVVMVDYTPIYSSATKNLHDVIHQKKLGDLVYYDSIRTNFGSNDFHSSVIWDLAIHDLALIHYLIDASPIAISAVAGNFVYKDHASLAHLTLFFENDIMANVYVNSISPEKMRHIVVAGKEKMAVYDDTLIDHKLKIIDVGINHVRDRDRYLVAKNNVYNSAHSIASKHNDGLCNMANHFITCVDKNTKPVTSCEMSFKLINMLESACLSLVNAGTSIELNHQYF